MARAIRSYFNEKAGIWDETIAERDGVKLEAMAGRLRIVPGSTVLDVGTGTGVFIPYLMRAVKRQGRLVALDVAEEMLKKANAKRFEGNIDYVQGNAAGLPLRSEKFEYVVCYSSFPHFEDKQISLHEAFRVLKGGGRLTICHTSSRREINDIHRQISAVANDVIPAEDEMRKLLAQAGFAQIEVEDNSDTYFASGIKPPAP